MEIIANLSPVMLGFLGSLFAGLMTSVGAIPVLLGKTPTRKWRDISLGFAAGVMLAASFFSLIIPALDAAEAQGASGATPALIVCIAILIGMAAVAALNETIPHEHFSTGREGPDAVALRRVWLFIIAIAIHNAPEGLAVAVALLGEKYSKFQAFSIAALTGLIEPVMGLLGAALIVVAQPLLPWGLAFAAGAMLYVISHEIIPETHRSGHQNHATSGLAIGLVVMLFLDVWLG